MKSIVPKSSGTAYKGVAKGKNLILIQTESFNNFVIGATYNGQEITPNLNKLLKKVLFISTIFIQQPVWEIHVMQNFQR